MRGGFFWRVALMIVGAAAVAALGLTAGAYVRFVQGGKIVGHYAVPFVRPAFGGKQQITLMILGLDVKDKLNPKDGQRSDSMMLMRIDFPTRSVKGLSIPRDTLADIPGQERQDKINSAYTVGGIRESIAAVEHLTGVHPDYYVVSDVSGFKRMVDLIGGIDLDVEKDMNYDDNWQNLHIHLKQGFQHLDGEKAMEYVRFRHDRFADLTRMQRQQRFLRAVAERMMALSNLSKLPAVLGEMHQAVQTDIEMPDLVYLATTLRHATGENIQMSTLPGEPRMIRRISYFIPDPKKSRELVGRIFNIEEVGGPATVEVLNGSGRRGLAGTFARKLEQSGYRVVRVGNADKGNHSTSSVVYRGEHADGADEIVGLLGVGDARPDDTGQPDSSGEADDSTGRTERRADAAGSTGKADITVIVGRDYEDASAP